MNNNNLNIKVFKKKVYKPKAYQRFEEMYNYFLLSSNKSDNDSQYLLLMKSRKYSLKIRFENKIPV